jgi:signal peptidase II
MILFSKGSEFLWILLLLDRLVKRALVWGKLCPAKMLPFMSCRLTVNRGISCGLFSSGADIYFYGLTALVGAFLCFFAWYIHQRGKEGYDTFGEMLVLVGGTSNFMDRLIYGGVIDFIHFYYGRWSFPVFNFSDIYIVLGVAIMLYNSFYEE